MIASIVIRQGFDLFKIHERSCLTILRADTDCLTIFNNAHDQDQPEQIREILNQNNDTFQYKIEHSNIRAIYNLKKRSYIFDTNDLRIIKVCGLRLSLHERNVGDISHLKFDTTKLGRVKRNELVTVPFGYKM